MGINKAVKFWKENIKIGIISKHNRLRFISTAII